MTVEPDSVRFHASDLGEALLFSDLPAWLGDAISESRIARFAGGEDYWYLRVQTPAGVVTAEPGDTIHRHFDGGLLVRSPDGLCKQVVVSGLVGS